MRVFIVDDEASARMIARVSLEEPDVEVVEYADAQKMMGALAETVPDVILLDIEMPGLNGIQACRLLRTKGFDVPHVMFVSAHNDMETRLAAYDAGGNDFIVKPYEPEELARKLVVARQVIASRNEWAAQTHEARQTAFTTMTTMGEMGVVLESLRTFFSCETPEALAGKLVDGLAGFGLRGLVGIRTQGDSLCRCQNGSCSPLERSILEHASSMDRIFQFGNRMVINYPGVTLVAQPLPLDDPDRVGRLRDHLAVFVEAGDARLQALETSRRQLAQSSGIGEAITQLSLTLAEINKLQANQRLRTADVQQRLLTDLTRGFVRLGLSEDQEKELTAIFMRSQAELNDLGDEGRSVGEHLQTVVRRLQKLVEI